MMSRTSALVIPLMLTGVGGATFMPRALIAQARAVDPATMMFEAHTPLFASEAQGVTGPLSHLISAHNY